MVINYNGVRNEIYNAILIDNRHHKLEKYSNKLEQWFRMHKNKTKGLISIEKYI